MTKQQPFIKSNDLQTLKPLVGDGLLTSEKSLHKQQRKLIQPSFTKLHITGYGEDMVGTAQQYLSCWSDGETGLISEDMMNITLGIISKTMFSLDFQEGAAKIGEPLETVMKQSINRMRSIIKFPLWFPSKKNRLLKQAIRELHLVLDEIIESRKEDPMHEDLLGVLLQAKDENNEPMSNAQLKDELMTIFLAGHETTANALSWTLYLLAQHPEIQKKFFEEIDSVIGAARPTPDHFKELVYTKNIVQEAMRLYPPAYVISRQADNDVEIGNYALTKGDMVIMSQYVMHRTEKFFPNPDSFMPERFERDSVKSLPTFAYFPFGGGPRVCIGNHFAMMEAVLVLACIGQRFQMIPASSEKIKAQPLITLRPKGGLTLQVKER